MKIYLVDDHDIIFGSYEAMLKQEGHEVVGTSKTGQDFIDFLEHNFCDIVFLDLSMPDMDGIEVLKKLYGKDNMPRVIIVSGYYHYNHIQEAFLLGALGFIDKTEIHHCIYEAIRKVANGKKYISDRVLENGILVQENSGDIVSVIDLLAERESEALSMMMNNLSNQEICSEMDIEPGTLRKMFQRIREKLGVKTNIQLAKLTYNQKHKLKK